MRSAPPTGLASSMMTDATLRTRKALDRPHHSKVQCSAAAGNARATAGVALGRGKAQHSTAPRRCCPHLPAASAAAASDCTEWCNHSHTHLPLRACCIGNAWPTARWVRSNVSTGDLVQSLESAHSPSDAVAWPLPCHCVAFVGPNLLLQSHRTGLRRPAASAWAGIHPLSRRMTVRTLQASPAASDSPVRWRRSHTRFDGGTDTPITSRLRSLAQCGLCTRPRRRCRPGPQPIVLCLHSARRVRCGSLSFH
jgi:hypothetical protein